MKINKDMQEKIKELQISEQNLQALLMQRQAFQLELNETETALSEVSKTGDEIYRITGQVMLKADKQEIEKELKEKKDILSLRLKSIEKEEDSLRKKDERLRQEISQNIGKSQD